MNENSLIRFYVNNGTDKTVKMVKNEKLEGLLNYMISIDCKTTGWAKQVAKHLLNELQEA